MTFRFNAKNASHLTIFDKTYGYGYVVLGECQKVPCVGLLDYGLGRDTLALIGEAFSREQEVEESVEGYATASRSLVFTNKRGALSNLHHLLVSEGFGTDELGQQFTVRGPLQIHSPMPIDGIRRLMEEVETHFRSKIESLLHLTETEGDIYTLTTMPSTEAKRPFMLVRVRLQEAAACDKKKKRKKLREWFDRLLPEASLVKFFIEESDFELGFFPSAGYIDRVLLYETPRFPPDRIDGYQVVAFDLEGGIAEENFMLMRDKLLETGAAVSCIREDGESILVEVPCSFAFGGVVGRAFESRLAFIFSTIEEQAATHRLIERRPLRKGAEYRPIKQGPLTAYPPGDIAFTRNLFSIDASKVPVLFERVGGGSEVFMLCNAGNFLAAHRRGELVEIYQGVLREREFLPDTVNYYPALVAAGMGGA